MYSNAIEMPLTQWEFIAWLTLFRPWISFNIAANYQDYQNAKDKEMTNYNTVGV